MRHQATEAAAAVEMAHRLTKPHRKFPISHVHPLDAGPPRVSHEAVELTVAMSHTERVRRAIRYFSDELEGTG